MAKRQIPVELAKLLDAVDPDRLMRTVEGICTGERLTNEAEARALNFMAQEFERAGCRVGWETHPAYISTPGRARLEVGGRAFECVTHPMTPATKGVSGPLRFLSRSEASGLGPDALRGAVALVEGLATEAAVRRLQEAGAAAAVFITGRSIHEMIVSRVWGSPTPATMNDYVSIPAVSVSLGDGAELRRLAAEGAAAGIETEVDTRWVDLPILTADIPGESDDFVMVTSHIDSWWLGAMDNASGNACGVEIARLLAPFAGKLRRGLRIVNWSGHSHGRYAGSTAYCDAHFEELRRYCVLNINADCLGGCGATVMTEAPSLAATHGLAERALREAAGVENYEGHRYSRSCDMSFWGVGVPAVFSQVSEQPPATGASADAFKALFGGGTKSGGYGWWWHTKDDTVEHLDPEFLARDVRVFLDAVWHAVTDEVLPLDAAAEARDLERGLRVWAEKAAGALDLSAALERSARLVRALEALDATVERGACTAHSRNRTVTAVLRILIPLGYVEGSIFSHDPAAGAPYVPMLRGVDGLQGADPHFRQCLLTALRRRVNELTWELGEALALVED